MIRDALRDDQGDPAHDPADIEGNSPNRQLTLYAQWELAENLALHMSLYYGDDLAVLNIPSYTGLDLRLGWRPHQDLEFSLVGQNLLDDRHVEFTSLDVVGSEIPRRVYGKLVWHG